MALGSDHVHGVLQRTDDGGKVFPRGHLGPRQIEDQAAAARSGHGAGEHGQGASVCLGNDARHGA